MSPTQRSSVCVSFSSLFPRVAQNGSKIILSPCDFFLRKVANCKILAKLDDSEFEITANLLYNPYKIVISVEFGLLGFKFRVKFAL